VVNAEITPHGHGWKRVSGEGSVRPSRGNSTTPEGQLFHESLSFDWFPSLGWHSYQFPVICPLPNKESGYTVVVQATHGTTTLALLDFFDVPGGAEYAAFSVRRHNMVGCGETLSFRGFC